LNVVKAAVRNSIRSYTRAGFRYTRYCK